MDPFAAALEAQFSAPGSAAAVYTPATGGGSINVRAIVRQPNTRTYFGTTNGAFLTRIVELQASAVAAPANGDTIIIIGGEIMQIAGSPYLDVERITWLCEVPELDRRIALLRQSRVRNLGGDWVEAFVAFAEDVPAAAQFAPGSEAITEAQDTAWSTAVFRIANSLTVADLKPRDRLRDRDGREFDITSVAELGDRAGLQIEAKASAD